MSNPFDYINDINTGKKNIIRNSDDPGVAERNYNPFITNRGLSYFVDTVLYANEMNINSHIDSKLQYEYYINIIRPKKRFAKWVKSVSEDDLELIKSYYGLSTEKAHQALSILSKDQIDLIKSKQEKGGVK